MAKRTLDLLLSLSGLPFSFRSSRTGGFGSNSILPDPFSSARSGWVEAGCRSGF